MLKKFSKILGLFLLCIVLPVSVPVGLSAVTSSCTKEQSSQIVNTLPPLGACIAQAAISDIVEAIADPLSLVQAIIAQCTPYGVATVEQIVAVIESLLSAPPTSPEAGSQMLAVHRARMSKVKAAALSQMHIVVVHPQTDQ